MKAPQIRLLSVAAPGRFLLGLVGGLCIHEGGILGRTFVERLIS